MPNCSSIHPRSQRRQGVNRNRKGSRKAVEFLDVNKSRVRQLAIAGQFEKRKGNIYDRASVEAYKLKRGDKKGGRYPKEKGMVTFLMYQQNMFMRLTR